MAAKKEKAPKGARMSVKGLGRVVLSNQAATRAAAMTLQKAVTKAGVPGFTVIVPGQKFQLPKGINKKKGKPVRRVSPE